MNVTNFLIEASEKGASDIYIVVAKPVSIKVNKQIVSLGGEPLTVAGTDAILKDIYRLASNRSFSKFDNGDDDFVINLHGHGRYRVNAYRQRNSLAAVIRVVPVGLPNPMKLNIPEVITNLADYSRGIVLFTGTTGSGKSTSLACLIDRINSSREAHIVTIEDPIEYLHPHKKSIVSQRELEADTETYLTAIRGAMRQVPDVILVGEMRDHDTISAAITAAETGHLVFSTLHTIGAAATIDRIIDVFPPGQQDQVRTQLSLTLQAVVSQQLFRTADGKMHPAYEIMIVNSAIRNLIRENKTFQIENIIQTSAAAGMRTMDMSIFDLCRQGIISKEDAVHYAVSPTIMNQRLSGQAR